MESTSTMLRKAMSGMFAIGAALSLLASVSSADTLLIEGIEGGITAPDRGVTQAAVVRDFGEPVGRSGPVGEPPISMWEYEPFVVYFEYDRVVHTVAKRQ